jgi:RecB family exonuclease
MPPPRLSSYRFWEDYQPDALEAIRATLARVIDDKTRQFDLFAPPPVSTPVDTPPASTPVDTPPAVVPARNETLGDVLSPSQANTFLNCSAKWWFRYGAGLPDAKGGSLERGLAVHKAIEHWYRAILDGAPYTDIDELREPYEDAWDALAGEAQFDKDDDIDDLKRSGARLLRLYLEQVAPEIKPAAVEVQVVGAIAGVMVRGYVDLVDTAGRIVDVKTASKSPAGISSDYALQLATYRALLPGSNGQARLDTLVNNKTPKLVTIEYQVSAEDSLLAQNLYPRVREGIREGLYFPNRNSNLCSRKYCNFADACCKEFGGCVA